ncbi:MAG: PorP/SprF family type IX secretion system membrane protein [Bacteroidales bacterium]|nr:PorP/SprF family type IX secretion system membrane protein [Bacteroidales bacterium]
MTQARYYLTTLVLLCTLSSSAQRTMFSQFYAAPLHTNPALAGSTTCGRFAVNYRNQWSMIPGASSSVSASYDEHFDRLSGALGFIITNLREGSGSYSTTSAGVVYSYSLQLTNAFSVRTAVQAGLIHRRIDWSNLTFPDQFDLSGFTGRPTAEDLPEAPSSRFLEDLSVGVVGYTDNFFAGLAIHHLSRPDEGFVEISRLPMRFTAHAGAVFDLRRTRGRFRDPNTPTISPNIIFQQQGTARQINYGVYFNNVIPMMVFGLWYRQTIAFNQPESITFLVGIRHNSLKIGYSYDISINGLRLFSGGSHELSMAYLISCRTPKAPRRRMLVCPAF